MCAKANMLYFLWGKWQTTLRLLLVREGEQIFKDYLTLEYRGRWTVTETNFLTFGEWFIHCSAQCAETIFLNNHRQVACSRHSDSGDSTKKSVSVGKKKQRRGGGGWGQGAGSRVPFSLPLSFSPFRATPRLYLNPWNPCINEGSSIPQATKSSHSARVLCSFKKASRWDS